MKKIKTEEAEKINISCATIFRGNMQSKMLLIYDVRALILTMIPSKFISIFQLILYL